MTERQIEQLISKYANGNASPEEIQQLRDWYQSFEVGDVLWSLSHQHEREELSGRILDRLKAGIAKQKSPVIHFPWVKIAAALFLLAGMAAILIYLYQSPTDLITVANPSGKIQQVTLPDGSSVWLNASTTLHHPKSFQKQRKVKLEGEAFFEVTHDGKHPFQVNAGGITTTVLGTRFNVKAYSSSESVSVSLLSGKVKVSDRSSELATLTPATGLLYDRKEKLSRTVSIDTNNVQAWRNGKLQFQGESFADIANALENWYGVKIIFSNSEMRSCRYYMTFDNTLPLKKLLATMAEIADTQFAFDEAGTTVTLSGKGCH